MTAPLTRIGVLIPEYPGQTHSFFWREMQRVAARPGHATEVFSTRLPAKPVRHAWVDQAPATYLYPLPRTALPGLLARLPWALARLAADPLARETLRDRKSWPMVLMALRLIRLARARGIDHLHVHSCANAALIAAFAHRLSGLPYSLVLHGPIEDYGPHQPCKWQGARFVFVITEKLRREMELRFPGMADRIDVVPMGVDTDTFAPARARPPAGAGRPFTWFCCARLNRVKGYDTLLDALARLRAEGHATRLVIAGEDEQGGSGYRREVEAMIDRLGLGDSVTLLGAVTQEEVLARLQSSDGFVLASRQEPLGVAYMEAMSCALPVVGTAAGGVAELISEGTDGLLVPPGDSPALAGAMARIMADPALAERLGLAARATILARFGAGRSADALVGWLAAPEGRGTAPR